MKLAPIILFVYNRPWHTQQTVEALKKNKLAEKSELFIFLDGPKNEEDKFKIKEIRKYIHEIHGFKSVKIVKRKKNLGLAKSIIKGVTEVINKYGKVIVLEDDLITSPVFIGYMNYLLNKYKDNERIFSITAYNHPKKLMKIPKKYKHDIYFCSRAASWSWATWKNVWNKVDWEIKDFQKFLKNKNLQKRFNSSGEDKFSMLIQQMNGKIDSWAIRWDFFHFKNNAYCIYPIESYVNNIGHDGTGVHSGRSTKFNQFNLNTIEKPKLLDKIKLDSKLMNNFKKVYKKNIFRRIIFKLIKNTFIYKYYKKLRYKK